MRELCLQVVHVCWDSPFLSWHENSFHMKMNFHVKGCAPRLALRKRLLGNSEMAYSSFIKLCLLHRHLYNWTLASQSLLVLAYKCFWLLLHVISVYCLLNYNYNKQLENLLKRQKVAFFSITHLGSLKGLLMCTPK